MCITCVLVSALLAWYQNEDLDHREKTVKSKTGRGSRKGEAEAVGWLWVRNAQLSP